MSKKYSFVFHGTKEMFEDKINQYFTENKENANTNNYMIDSRFGDYAFGIKRGGHSGGYWYEPKITEQNGNLIISGRIEYLTPYNDTKIKRFFGKIEDGCLMVFLFPLFLLVKVYQLIKKLVYKMRHKPLPKEETEEDRLFYLMENILGCTRM